MQETKEKILSEEQARTLAAAVAALYGCNAKAAKVSVLKEGCIVFFEMANDCFQIKEKGKSDEIYVSLEDFEGTYGIPKIGCDDSNFLG